MSTQRYISTSFWDDEWIHTLDPSEKLMYLYFMTNPLTNIAGVYKLSVSRISYDTGFNENTIGHIMQKFEKAKKAFRIGEYIALPSWPKHQKWEVRSKIMEGIVICLRSLPSPCLIKLVEIGYNFDLKPIFDTLSIPYPYDTIPYGYHPNYSDSDIDLNSDTDKDIDSKAVEPPAVSFSVIKPEPINNGSERIGYAQKCWNYAEQKPASKISVLQFKPDDLSGCLATVQAYTNEEIEQAINNYAKISASPAHDIGFKYGSFQGFMKSGVEKFVNDSDPWNKYRKTEAETGQPIKPKNDRACAVCNTPIHGTMSTCGQCGFDPGIDDPVEHKQWAIETGRLVIDNS